MYKLIRWAQSPTNWGCEDVHAEGSIVSKALVKPWIILKPETLAVIDPKVMAASAVVDIWPIEITEDMMRLNSNTWVLPMESKYHGSMEDRRTHAKTGKAYLVRIRSSSQKINTVLPSSDVCSIDPSIRGTGGLSKGVFSDGIGPGSGICEKWRGWEVIAPMEWCRYTRPT